MRRTALLTALLAVLASTGAGLAQNGQVLHVATGGKEADAEVYYAQELGLFKKAGLTVEITTMASGSIIAGAVAGGSLDIGTGSVLVVATARARGVPFVFIAPGAAYSSAAPTTVLAVSATSPVRTAKDLNGKTIGVIGLRGLDQIAPQAWMDQNGADSASVKFLEMGPTEMPAALDAGRIDAAELADPVLSAVRNKIRILASPEDVIGKQFMITGWFATSEWVASHLDAARRFAAVIRETARWANANPDQAGLILEKYAKLPPDPTHQRPHVPYLSALSASMLAPIVSLGAKYGVLANPPAVADLVAKGL